MKLDIESNNKNHKNLQVFLNWSSKLKSKTKTKIATESLCVCVREKKHLDKIKSSNWFWQQTKNKWQVVYYYYYYGWRLKKFIVQILANWSLFGWLVCLTFWNEFECVCVCVCLFCFQSSKWDNHKWSIKFRSILERRHFF